MTLINSDNAPPATQRWLAETLRLHEAQQGPLDDSQLTASVAMADLAPEQCILRRAQFLARDQSWLNALKDWKKHAGLLCFLLLFLAFVSGFLSALAVLGETTGPINLFWAITALLGLHLATLMLWVFSSISQFAPGGLLGQAWLWLLAKLPASPRNSLSGQAALGILNRSHASYWGLSLITHSLWLAALLGVTAGSFLALALRSYSFNLETTILAPETFIRAISIAGWLPARFNIDIPDADTIRATLGNPEQGEHIRRIWASWLLSMLLIYGVLPRLLLSGLCLFLFRRRLAGFRLDLKLPAYTTLLARLKPHSQPANSKDQPAPPSLPASHAGSYAGELITGSRQLILFELDQTAEQWAQPNLAPLAKVESREQRHQVLQQLQQAPVERLLIVCNRQLSPDRSTLNWIAQASWYARQTTVLLLAQADSSPDHERVSSWQHSLIDTGFTAAQLYLDKEPAVRWLTE
ncbi:MAG: DUF2868 domain-containing protein [Pseudomonadales bacterium]|nr:DUF2868 domain-containing protein [Pseudomonadales bacterium]